MAMTTYDNQQEMLPVVDEAGNIVDGATRGVCHGGSFLLHPVVHLHVFDGGGRLYLQRRPAWKDIQPGRWDTAVGGHVALGESVEEALRREAREELGLTGFEAERLWTYVHRSECERELVYSFRTVWSGAIAPSEETAGGRYWTRREVEESLGRGVFTPNFEAEWERLAAVLKEY